MTDIPTLQQPLQLPSDMQHGIGAAVKHALMFAPSMTDIMIHEGHVMRAKSARGTLPLHQLFAAIPPFIVTREHIVTYLAGYVDGATRQHRDDRGQQQSVQQYWDTRIKPVLARQRSVNIRLDGRGGHSLRYSLFMHGTGELALVMRITPPDITPLTGLSLPHNLVSTLTEATSGFIVITGPTGSGKSETAMSILDWHNAQHSGHILTIEDPVEKKIAPRKSIVTQREVGYDVLSFADGMREALRMSPDVLLTSEIRDAETAEQAIQGGESGSLMIATTHGKSVTGTMRKILSYTGTSADVMRSVLAGNLIAVIRQALVPSKDGKRYLMAADVLFNTGKVTQYIERGDWIGLESAIREDNRLGASEWVPMNNRLVELVRRGEIEAGEAMRETSDIPTLKRKLAAAGVPVIGR
ncbi:MAG TPA: ATPase, T2SS/T4P/T4SS family [Burkholderiaceae bacterium]|jgi:pilus retraction protein PilT|nr:ATPase, T2SS/T4P/T4SS family [Burkholderiaceae bacterium]